MNIQGKPTIRKLRDIDDAYTRHMAYLDLQTNLEDNQKNIMAGLPPVVPTAMPDPRTLAQRRADLIEQRSKATQNILKLNIDKHEVNKILQEMTDDDIKDLNQIYPVLQKEISKFDDIDSDFFISFFRNLLKNLKGSDYQLGLVNFNPMNTEEIEFDDEMYEYLENSLQDLESKLIEIDEGLDDDDDIAEMGEFVENIFNNYNIDKIYFRFIAEYISTKKHNQRQINILSKMNSVAELLNKIETDYNFGTYAPEIEELWEMDYKNIDNQLTGFSNVDNFIQLVEYLPNIGNKKVLYALNFLLKHMGTNRSKGFFKVHKEKHQAKMEKLQQEQEESRQIEEDKEFQDPLEKEADEEDEYEEAYSGNGIKKFINTKRQRTTPRVIFGSGLGKIEEIPKWMLFGKFAIHYPELKRNILNIKYKSLSQIPDLNKKIKISDDLKDLIDEILKNGSMSKVGYKNLTEKDKKIFDIISTKAGLYDKFGIKPIITQSKDIDLDKEMKRFELVKGEWMAGNNNDEVKQELILLISKFINLKMISEEDGKDILKDLLKK